MPDRVFEADHLTQAEDAVAADRPKGVLADGEIDSRFKPPLSFIRERVEPYRKVSREPAKGHRTVDAADHCNALLREVRSRCPSEKIMEDFFAWATARFDWPALLHVLAAHKAWREADRSAVFRHAERAMAIDPLDLYAQHLVIWAKDETGEAVASLEDWLKDRFCPRPFEAIETRPNGDVNTCCNAWMPAPIGNLGDAIDGIWNSDVAREIRRSVLDGDFRYCSRTFCPKIAERSLPHRDDVENPDHLAIMRERKTVIARRPRRVLLSHDRSCNLACPSCRSQKILAGKREQTRLKAIADDVLLPLLKDAHIAKVTGSGDPFGSHHFRYVLKQIDADRFPDLRLEIQTNGQLLDRRAWRELGLDGQVDSIWISIDAATSETYEKLRRGGSFARLMKNLAFVGELRRQGAIRLFRLDTVVQKDNAGELRDIVGIGRRFGADIVSFQRIRNWGTFSAETFREQDIASPSHPEFMKLVETLRSPAFDGRDIELGNLLELRGQSVSGHRDTSSGYLPGRHADSVETSLKRAYKAARSGDGEVARSHLRAAISRSNLRVPKNGHFLFVHMGRCGSTVLADLLGQRPDITWDNELFTSDRGLWKEGDNPFDLLFRRLQARKTPLYGFELKTWQPEEIGVPMDVLVDCFELFGIDRHLLLKRQNLIRRTLSSDLGHKTGEWHARSKKTSRPRKLTVKLTNPHFVSRLRAQERLWDTAVQALAGKPFIELTYEADVMDDPIAAYRRVCAFHRLRPFDGVEARLAKTVSFPLKDMIENYQDLACSLRGTGYEDMLVDQ